MPDGQDAAPAWKTLLALFTLASFIETLFWGQVIGFTPLYLTQLGVAPQAIATWTGTIAALSMALGLPFLPLWGALADRYARKPVIVRSFAAYLIAGIVTFLAPNVWIFTLGRAVMGFSFGNSGLMMTTLSERVPRQRLAFAFSVMNASGPIGAFIGPIVGGAIVDAPGAGFPGLVLVDGVLLLVVILALSVGYRDAFVPTDTRPLLRMALDSVRVVWRSPMLPLFPALLLAVHRLDARQHLRPDRDHLALPGRRPRHRHRARARRRRVRHARHRADHRAPWPIASGAGAS